jgi:hypothetical protein
MNEILLNTTNTSLARSGVLSQLVVKPITSSAVLEMRRRVTFGLIKPENERYLTGETKDRDMMVKSVTFKVPDIKQTIEAKIDDEGYISFSTANAVMATKETIVKIITLVCTPVECIKGVINIRLHPIKGFIKGKVFTLDMQYGEDINREPISDIYTVDDIEEPKDENKKEI